MRRRRALGESGAGGLSFVGAFAGGLSGGGTAPGGGPGCRASGAGLVGSAAMVFRDGGGSGGRPTSSEGTAFRAETESVLVDTGGELPADVFARPGAARR